MHWINVIAFSLLLMSGLQIFNVMSVKRGVQYALDGLERLRS